MKIRFALALCLMMCLHACTATPTPLPADVETGYSMLSRLGGAFKSAWSTTKQTLSAPFVRNKSPSIAHSPAESWTPSRSPAESWTPSRTPVYHSPGMEHFWDNGFALPERDEPHTPRMMDWAADRADGTLQLAAKELQNIKQGQPTYLWGNTYGFARKYAPYDSPPLTGYGLAKGSPYSSPSMTKWGTDSQVGSPPGSRSPLVSVPSEWGRTPEHLPSGAGSPSGSDSSRFSLPETSLQVPPGERHVQWDPNVVDNHKRITLAELFKKEDKREARERAFAQGHQP